MSAPGSKRRWGSNQRKKSTASCVKRSALDGRFHQPQRLGHDQQDRFHLLRCPLRDEEAVADACRPGRLAARRDDEEMIDGHVDAKVDVIQVLWRSITHLA